MADESKICTCTTPEYTINLEKQGPPGVKGETGENGFSPVITVAQNTLSNYSLNILTADGMVVTPNLKANLPAGGATGQVLTKNSGTQDDCSWQNLPNATAEVEGIARLATENDFETTEDSAVSDTSIVTPALFNSEFEKQSANLVTTDTCQTITGNKVFKSSLIFNAVPENGNLGGIITNNGVTGNDPIIKISEEDNVRYLEIGHPSSYNPAGFKIPFNGNYVELHQGSDSSKIVQLDALKNLYLQAGDNIIFEDYPLTGGIKISATGGSGGTTDYTQLTNKPQINGIELTGNKNGNDLGLANESEIEELGNEVNQLTDDVTNLSNNSVKLNVANTFTESQTMKQLVTTNETDPINVLNFSGGTVLAVNYNGLDCSVLGLVQGTETYLGNAYGGIWMRTNGYIRRATGSGGIYDVIDTGNIDNKTLVWNGTTLKAVASAPTNMVTTDTDQSISGSKTFVGTTTINGYLYINSNTGITANAPYIDSIGLRTLRFIDGFQLINNSNNSSVLEMSGSTLQVGSTSYPTNIQGSSVTINGQEIPSNASVTNLQNAIGNLKYWTGTEADYTGLATKDADTLYRTTDTNTVYLGIIQLSN